MKTTAPICYKLLITLLVISLYSCKEKGPECPIPEDITYTNTIANLVETKCFMCHAPDVYKTKASRMKMYDYASLKKATESGQLMGSITHTKGYIPMPYRKNEKIDTCSIVLFQQWIAGGMKE